MANQSFAKGKVSVIAKDYDAAREVADLLNSVTSYFSFYTSLNIDDKVIPMDNKNCFECCFDGI